MERSGLVEAVRSLSAAKQAWSMRQSSRRLSDSRLNDQCIVCCLADRLPPSPMPLTEPVLSLTLLKKECAGHLTLEPVKDSLGETFLRCKAGKSQEHSCYQASACQGSCDHCLGCIYMSTYFNPLIFPFLPAPLSNDRCWKRSCASAAAVQVSSPWSDHDSDAEEQHPAELDPQQLAQPCQPSLGVGRKGTKKRSTGALGWGSKMERRIGGAIFAHGPAGLSPWEMLC